MTQATLMIDYTALPTRQKVLTLAGVLLGMLLAALDQTIVSTAGPTIQRELHMQPALYAWLTTSYLVASVVMTPIWGKLSDQFGRRRILVIGILIFLAGSLLCGVAQTTEQLIGARVIQGLGSAALFTTAFAVIGDLFVPRERGRYAGIFGATFGLSSVVGPLLGGFLTDTVGWHWCFLINLPVGAIALFVILTRMPTLHQPGRNQTIDVMGSILFACSVVPLLLALSFAKVELREGDIGYLWNSPPIAMMLAAFGVFFGLFIVVEKRAVEPIIDLHMMRIKPYRLGLLASFASSMSFLGAIVFLPLFMVNVVGASATSAGLTTTPLTFGIVVANIVCGTLSSKFGRYKVIIIASLLVQVVAFSLMSLTLSTDVSTMGMAARMVLVGIGLGPAIALFNVHISSSVPPEKMGIATATATLARSLGTTVGIAIFGNVFGLTLAHEMESRMADATKDLPAAVAEQLKANRNPATNGGEAGEVGASATFDVVAIKERVKQQFSTNNDKTMDLLLAPREQQMAMMVEGKLPDHLREVVGEAARAPPEARVIIAKRMQQAAFERETNALNAIDKMGVGIRLAFTSSVAKVYFVAIYFALVGLLVSLWLPEQKLRARGEGPAPPVE
jgi:EmrB/QacA subfamily drug resistance transporter